MDFEEKQAEVSDALQMARALVEALESAESCETAADFAANITEAHEILRNIRNELKELK